MAVSRKLVVEFLGDTASLEKSLARANKRLAKFEGQSTGTSKKIANGFKGLGVGISAYGLVSGLRSVVSASVEAEKSQAKLNAQLKAIGKSSEATRKSIDRVVQAQSMMSGFDDEALTDSFTNIVRVTGDVEKALKLNALAMDLARAKNMDVARAGEIVGKVAGGNVGILSRYGLSVKKGATASEALAMLQDRLAGQAESYGRTQAGSIDRMNTAWENLREKLGDALAPAVSKAADGVAKFVTQMQNGTGAGGKFADAVKEAVTPVGKIAGAVAGFVRSNPDLAKAAASFAIIGGAAAKLSSLTGAGGLVKLAFGRGNTPLTPLYVKEVAPGGGKPTPIGGGKVPPVLAASGPPAATAVAVAGNQSKAFKGGPTIGTGLPAGDKAGFGLTKLLRTQLAEVIGLHQETDREMDRFGALLVVQVTRQWELVNTSTRQKLRDINGVVRSNMKRVRGAMERDSSAGAAALRANISGAITAVQNSMHTGTVSVETGMARINSLLRTELKQLGVNYLSADGKSPAIQAGALPKPTPPRGGSKYVLAPEQGGMRLDSATSSVPRRSGGGSFAARGPAARLRDWLSRRGFATTSEGRSNSDTYHGMGLALDYGTSRNDLHRLARVLWPARKQFEELFIPTWAPHGGLYHNGRKFTDARLQAGHQDHIHVAETSGFNAPEIEIPRVKMARGLGALTAIGQAALDRARSAAVRFGNKRLEEGGAPVGYSRLMELWEQAGGSAAAARKAAAVALAESGGNPRALNRNADGSIDRGLWQINSVHGALSTFDQLGNARAAVRISKGGRDWSPWVAYKNGRWRRFLKPTATTRRATRKTLAHTVKQTGKAGFGHSGMNTFGGFPRDTGNTPAARSFLKIPETSTVGGFDLAGGRAAAAAQGIPMVDTSTPAGMSQQDRDEVLKGILAELKVQNARAERVGSTSGGVLARAVADVASGQIAGQVIRGAQTPMWPGSGARY